MVIPMKVLIVEEDRLLAEVFATALADEGIESEVIADDETAIAVCKHDEPQLVITSMNRARDDMSGWCMVRTIRNRWPRIASVLMAALRPAQVRALGPRERFLSKPVSIATFVKTVRELLPA